MGDDSFGQCGQGDDGDRPEVAPFKPSRLRKPRLIIFDSKIMKIDSGHRHNLAIDERGHLWGWGYNNQQQLSFAADFANESSPSMVLFSPK